MQRGQVGGGRAFVGAPLEAPEGDEKPLEDAHTKKTQMRAFHFAWMSFFIAFVCWFAFAPLIVLVKQDLELTLSQVFTTNILAVAGMRPAR